MKKIVPIVLMLYVVLIAGCLPNTSSPSAPVFPIKVGTARVITASITINGQTTYTQQSPVMAQLSTIAITNQTVLMSLRLEFSHAVNPPSNTYLQCGNVMLSPSVTGTSWTFQGNIPSVPECTIYVYNLPYSFATGIAATTVVVGEQRAVISEVEAAPSYLLTDINITLQGEASSSIAVPAGTVITLSLPSRVTYITVNGGIGEDLPVLAVCSINNDRIDKRNTLPGRFKYVIDVSRGTSSDMELCVIGRPDVVLLVMYWRKR